MFKLIKEIKSKEGVLHFRRWNILTSKRLNFSLYLHGIYKADEDQHLHNHPWNIATIILWGSYLEDTNTLTTINQTVNRHWLHFGYRSKQQFHKILKLNSKRVFSLAFVFGKRTDWGYNVNGVEIQNEEYRLLKNLTDFQVGFLTELRLQFPNDKISICRGERITVNNQILKGILFPVDNDREKKLKFHSIEGISNEIKKQFNIKRK